MKLIPVCVYLFFYIDAFFFFTFVDSFDLTSLFCSMCFVPLFLALSHTPFSRLGSRPALRHVPEGVQCQGRASRGVRQDGRIALQRMQGEDATVGVVYFILLLFVCIWNSREMCYAVYE
jgi:hypothetical protein